MNILVQDQVRLAEWRSKAVRQQDREAKMSRAALQAKIRREVPRTARQTRPIIQGTEQSRWKQLPAWVALPREGVGVRVYKAEDVRLTYRGFLVLVPEAVPLYAGSTLAEYWKSQLPQFPV